MSDISQLQSCSQSLTREDESSTACAVNPRLSTLVSRFGVLAIKRRGRKPILESNAQLNAIVENIGGESSLQTFHFNPSDDCSSILYSFATEHRNDNSKQFKLAWDAWIKEPEVLTILEQESNILKAGGYSGDPFDKMYSSARYYYRKKALKKQQNAGVSQTLVDGEDTPKEKTPRKKYESADSHLLEQINLHIMGEMTTFESDDALRNCGGCNISPAQSFENYLAKFPSTECDKTKLKKIYKNRLFLLRQKLKMNA